MNKRTIKSLLVASALSLATTLPVQAKETSKEKTQEELLKGLKTVSEWCEDVGNSITEKVLDKTQNLKPISYDSLWIITDMPGEDPNEKRHYYIVHKDIYLPNTFFFDAKGNKTEPYDKEATRKYEQISYGSISEVGTSFTIRNDYDLKSNTFTTNFIDFDSTYFYDSSTTAEFDRFTNIFDILPPELQQPTYSSYDILKIAEFLNDYSFEIPTSQYTLSLLPE